MTGEMIKPKEAEEGEEFWRGKSGLMGMGSAIGDSALLIKPNYPQIFELRDAFKAEGIKCDVKPFDVYQGPYLDCSGKKKNFKVWYESDAPPELGEFLVEFYKKGQIKFVKIHGFDISNIEARISRKR